MPSQQPCILEYFGYEADNFHRMKGMVSDHERRRQKETIALQCDCFRKQRKDWRTITHTQQELVLQPIFLLLAFCRLIFLLFLSRLFKYFFFLPQAAAQSENEMAVFEEVVAPAMVECQELLKKTKDEVSAEGLEALAKWKLGMKKWMPEMVHQLWNITVIFIVPNDRSY